MKFSILENLDFAATFTPFRGGMNSRDVFQLLPEKKRHKSKPIALLSSGMIQRVKLLLAIMADVPLVGLDEPLTNLDDEGVQWYTEMVSKYLTNSTVLVASHNPEEYSLCDRVIRLGTLTLPQDTKYGLLKIFFCNFVGTWYSRTFSLSKFVLT